MFSFFLLVILRQADCSSVSTPESAFRAASIRTIAGARTEMASARNTPSFQNLPTTKLLIHFWDPVLNPWVDFDRDISAAFSVLDRSAPASQDKAANALRKDVDDLDIDVLLKGAGIPFRCAGCDGTATTWASGRGVVIRRSQTGAAKGHLVVIPSCAKKCESGQTLRAQAHCELMKESYFNAAITPVVT